jgi:hypothetical protein
MIGAWAVKFETGEFGGKIKELPSQRTKGARLMIIAYVAK